MPDLCRYLRVSPPANIHRPSRAKKEQSPIAKVLGNDKGLKPTAKFKAPLCGENRWAKPTNQLTASSNYSHRRAIIGSTFVARRAGIQQASNATAMSSSAIAENVAGSVALTPKSRFFIVRVNANDEIGRAHV